MILLIIHELLIVHRLFVFPQSEPPAIRFRVEREAKIHDVNFPEPYSSRQDSFPVRRQEAGPLRFRGIGWLERPVIHYEGGIRVPFIIAWEGVVSPGSENRDAFAFWDLYPTFRDILSRTGDGSRRKTQDTVDKCADGISILPALTGTGRQRHHKMLYFEFHEDGGRQAVISGDMKLIKLHASSENGQIWELYDLKNDPSETVNLLDAEHTSARYRKIAARLRKIMQQEHVADPVWPLLDCELRQAQAN